MRVSREREPVGTEPHWAVERLWVEAGGGLNGSGKGNGRVKASG